MPLDFIMLYIFPLLEKVMEISSRMRVAEVNISSTFMFSPVGLQPCLWWAIGQFAPGQEKPFLTSPHFPFLPRVIFAARALSERHACEAGIKWPFELN